MYLLIKRQLFSPFIDFASTAKSGSSCKTHITKSCQTKKHIFYDTALKSSAIPLFLFPLWCLAHCNISVFMTPATSFYIHNQDPLLMDVCLLQGTKRRPVMAAKQTPWMCPCVQGFVVGRSFLISLL